MALGDGQQRTMIGFQRPEERGHALDSRSRIRSVLDAISGVAFIAAILLGVVLIVLLGDRVRSEAGAGDGPSAVAAAPSANPPSNEPSLPLVLASGPPILPLETSTSAPTTATTTAPGPRATVRPPRPTGDPRPEGTPHYHRASGRIGETIVNDEVSIRVERAEIPATYDYGLCGRANAGYTESFAFEITESWTRWTSMDWTFVMGNTQPVVNWIEDVPNYGNGASTVSHVEGASRSAPPPARSPATSVGTSSITSAGASNSRHAG